MLVDTHAHLYWDSYKEDLSDVLKKCFDAGVKLIINVGVDLKTSKIAAQQDLSPLISFSTAGIHPHDVSGFKDTDELEELILQNKEKIVAVGECGLDYYRLQPVIPAKAGIQNMDPGSESGMTIQEQMKAYIAQVELAKKLNLPLVIHCRDAWHDIFIEELQGTTGLFHNFSGSLEDAQYALNLGYYLSFSAVITYPKNENLRNIIKELPLDKILTETDCPFLPPQQIRGQRNDPSYIKDVIEVISQIKNLPPEEVEAQILKNTQTLFNLPQLY